MQLRTLLVPVDFSPASKNAFQYAMHLAGMQGGRLILFHAYVPGMLEPYMDFGMQTALLKQQEALALQFFHQLEEEVPETLRGQFALEFKMQLGPAGDGILEAAKELNPDLIVMGTRGGNLITRKILGSTVNHVIHGGEVPVLIIPEEARFQGLRSLAYATDYEEDDIRFIDEVLYFAKQQEAKLSCIHIRKADNARDTYQGDLLRRAYQHDLDQQHIEFQTLIYPDVVEGLQHFSQWQQVDLLVMLTHRRSQVRQLFQRSHARDLALQTRVPLWVYPLKEPVKTPLDAVPDEYSL
ncbi:MAG: universal stress protein [Bacteroidetes bacterium]|nr:MAG: universal stress protein [Bacteroidota bacterium]